jgi:hypothetical protein
VKVIGVSYNDPTIVQWEDLPTSSQVLLSHQRQLFNDYTRYIKEWSFCALTSRGKKYREFVHRYYTFVSWVDWFKELTYEQMQDEIARMEVIERGQTKKQWNKSQVVKPVVPHFNEVPPEKRTAFGIAKHLNKGRSPSYTEIDHIHNQLTGLRRITRG